MLKFTNCLTLKLVGYRPLTVLRLVWSIKFCPFLDIYYLDSPWHSWISISRQIPIGIWLCSTHSKQWVVSCMTLFNFDKLSHNLNSIFSSIYWHHWFDMEYNLSRHQYHWTYQHQLLLIITVDSLYVQIHQWVVDVHFWFVIYNLCSLFLILWILFQLYGHVYRINIFLDTHLPSTLAYY